MGNLINLVLTEQRHQRQDLQDIKRMLNKLIIDEHLSQQANEFFEREQADQGQSKLDAPTNDLEDK